MKIWTDEPAFSRNIFKPPKDLERSSAGEITSVKVPKIEASRVIVGQCESRIRVCIVANTISRKNPSLEKSPTASKTTLVRDL